MCLPNWFSFLHHYSSGMAAAVRELRQGKKSR